MNVIFNMLEEIEHFLLNYFNEVRWVDTDIVIDNIVSISKENGIIKQNIEEKIFNLQSLLTPSLEGINGLLYLEFNKRESIFIKSKFIDKILFRKYNININSNEWVITSTYNYKKFFYKKDINVYISDDFDDLIVIGNKNIELIINNNFSSFYTDYSKFRLYKTKKSS